MAEQSGVSDLQAILATLAQYSAQAGQTAPTEPNTPQPDNASFTSKGSSTAQGNWAQQAPAKAHDPRLPRPQSRSGATTPKPMIDPASITIWQEGLRCVTKIAAQNTQFAASIKRMIKDQRANEMRWYSERQNLKHVQANRSVEAAKAHSILKSLTTSFYEAPPEVESPEDKKERELLEFDQKIYMAQESMDAAMTAELKSLGVPFFGTDASLVVPDDWDQTRETLPEGHPKWSPLVTTTQMLELRRKMVGHLEDLYRD
ncbi:hypothetical protein Slin15195_G083640 [Septoria linicola]|uniref:Uncharacterized protein n=1 Tax=Septoria linicola TaxID=215465 RepID=A0A9Q9AYV6_9PEZI|nr:hypothetical protein Slin15195_G083640 [Septoria linicola]